MNDDFGTTAELLTKSVFKNMALQKVYQIAYI